MVWGRQIEGKKAIGRPSTKQLDWMIRKTDSRTYEDPNKLTSDISSSVRCQIIRIFGGHGISDLSKKGQKTQEKEEKNQ